MFERIVIQAKSEFLWNKEGFIATCDDTFRGKNPGIDRTLANRKFVSFKCMLQGVHFVLSRTADAGYSPLRVFTFSLSISETTVLGETGQLERTGRPTLFSLIFNLSDKYLTSLTMVWERREKERWGSQERMGSKLRGKTFVRSNGHLENKMWRFSS